MDNLKTIQRMKNLREDSFWYDGLIATLGKYSLYAVGEIRVNFPEDQEQTYSDSKAVEKANQLGYIDNNLQDVEWFNNNWFEVGWKNEAGKLEFDIGIVEHDYLSGIDLLKAYYKGEI